MVNSYFGVDMRVSWEWYSKYVMGQNTDSIEIMDLGIIQLAFSFSRKYIVKKKPPKKIGLLIQLEQKPCICHSKN